MTFAFHHVPSSGHRTSTYRPIRLGCTASRGVSIRLPVVSSRRPTSSTSFFGSSAAAPSADGGGAAPYAGGHTKAASVTTNAASVTTAGASGFDGGGGGIVVVALAPAAPAGKGKPGVAPIAGCPGGAPLAIPAKNVVCVAGIGGTAIATGCGAARRSDERVRFTDRVRSSSSTAGDVRASTAAAGSRGAIAAGAPPAPLASAAVASVAFASFAVACIPNRRLGG